MNTNPITEEGLAQWEASEWKCYANRISADKGCLFLEVKVGEPLYRVGQATSEKTDWLYQGSCSAEAVKVWNENRHKFS